ncbi:Long-chain-fatty-acid--CoA ligase [Variovorax sp. PBL-H6]|uniref:AMP-binding protein n=1 Tax=Variovorax sp. PBL-H6 TaxID=434009 RepID=UPI00131862C4|nr:AMP-binding protein [Variovorax sp. PBL-H6]VTU24862.1 Long-chain-fatty-acid--CoA ligase [Variovorax sp. PBL-H6]
MSSTWRDPRVPDAPRCVLKPVLERWAREQPDAVFARFDDGTEWTWAQTLDIAQRTAAGLQSLGVGQGDNVLSWLPNGPDALRVWFGANLLGAVYVPLNTAYRGRMLEHAVRTAKAGVMVVHAGLADRLAELPSDCLRDVVVVRATAAVPEGAARWHTQERLDGDAATLAAPPQDIQPWHTQSIVFTSGTTGPSKGVESSYLHLFSASFDPFPYLASSDRYLVSLPLFHVGGTVAVYAMLLRGASVAIVDSFRLDTFWQTVAATRSTFCCLLGSMATLLAKAPPSHEDQGHGLRHALMIPLSEDAVAFKRRFGCDIYTLFNMSEISVPLVSGVNPTALGTCGRPRSGVEVRIVDENDCEVAPGDTGELLVRSDRPWALAHAYFGDPQATARAWRNGWFHTGDAFRVDPDGDYRFVDRMKDSIRRRGENISSFEVEAEVCTHPAVLEAAAVAVPSPHGEDDVLVAVVLRPGASLDPAQLLHHLIARMPHFMVPRYVRVVAALPRTPTQKVQKHALRAQGVTADCWDREAAGVRVRRTELKQG